MMSKAMEAIKKAQEVSKKVVFICEWGKDTIVIPRDHIIPNRDLRHWEERGAWIGKESINGPFIFYLAELGGLEIIKKTHMSLLTPEEVAECSVLCQDYTLTYSSERKEYSFRKTIGNWFPSSKMVIKEEDLKFSCETQVDEFIVQPVFMEEDGKFHPIARCDIYVKGDREVHLEIPSLDTPIHHSEKEVTIKLGEVEVPAIGCGFDKVIEIKKFIDFNDKKRPVKIRIGKNFSEVAHCMEYKAHLGKFYEDKYESDDGMSMRGGQWYDEVVVDKEEYEDYTPLSISEIETLVGQSLSQMVEEHQILAWRFESKSDADAWQKKVLEYAEQKILERKEAYIELLKKSPYRKTCREEIREKITLEEVEAIM